MPIQHLKIKSAEPRILLQPPGPAIQTIKTKAQLRKEFWGKNKWAVVGSIALVFAIVGIVYLVIFFSQHILSDTGVEESFDVSTIPESISISEKETSVADKSTHSDYLTYSNLFTGKRRLLLLLQNSAELRPTGGLIGTVAVLEMDDGELIDYTITDSYSIDSNNKNQSDGLSSLAPQAVTKYLGHDQLSFRDANWFSDFRDSASLLKQFYTLASKDFENFDAVMAINSDVVGEMLGILGPVTFDGIEINQTNVGDMLGYGIEANPMYKGKVLSERRQIVNTFFRILVTRAFGAPEKEREMLVSLAQNALNQKETQLYFFDPELEKQVVSSRHAGAFSDATGDFVALVDANVNAIETDRVIRRTIGYSLREQEGQLFAKLNITYDHSGYYDWKTDVYKTFARVYLPLGSVVTSLKTVADLGVLRDVPIEERGEYQSKTYIGFFTTVQPKSQRDVVIEYELPKQILEQAREGRYTLVVQKQSGTFSFFHADIDFEKPIGSVFASKGSIENENGIVSQTLDADAIVEFGL